MRSRSRWLYPGACGVVAATLLLTWSLIQGQERPVSYVTPATPAPIVVLPGSPETAPGPRVEPAAGRPARDFSKLPLLQQQMFRSALRGADWLSRANDSDGHFTYGFIPSLKVGLEGDHFLRQAGAAFALARAARLTGDERQVARARQAVLLLLAETALDPKNPSLRSTTAPPVVVNRVAAAGALLMAIHELPAPAEDLLQQSDQLCNYLRTRQQADGAFTLSDADNPAAASDLEAINAYPGAALGGLMLSQRHRPAPWKIEVARKALKRYEPWWREHRNGAFVPLQTAAYVEAFLLAKDPAFAAFVNEMADWVSALQYAALDPRHPAHWGGGFMEWKDGQPVNAPPQIVAAGYAEALADACRLARAEGDLARYKRYREALERSLQFVTRLQYTEAGTQHFAEWYRPALVGAFYVSFQDGNVRIDNTQHAVCALVQYLLEVVDKNES